MALLVLLGLAWGVTVPLTKIAVEAGYRDFGIVFWVSAIDVMLLAPVLRRLPLHRGALAIYVFLGLFANLLPVAASSHASVYLPAGVVALGLSFVPLMALPVALALGTDRPDRMRLLGLLAGLAGVALMIRPGADLSFAPHLFLLALIAPVFYAFEGNVIARWGSAGLSPLQMICGASFLAATISGPVALLRGDFISPLPPWGLPQAALAGDAVISLAAYVGYLWMLGRAGAVFSAQVAYLVTGFGVVWSMLLLGERFPPGYWAALALTLTGVFLVQPRPPRLRDLDKSATTEPLGPQGRR